MIRRMNRATSLGGINPFLGPLRRKTGCLAILNCSAMALILVGCQTNRLNGRKQLVVDTEKVKPISFANEVVTISTLEAAEAVELAAQAGGRIERLLVKQGDTVQPGQLIVKLDQAQLQAEVASLRAAKDQNLLNFRRFDYLAGVGAASSLQRDQLRQTYISSTASLKAKEADLAYKDLRSPIGGIIGDLRIKRGDLIKAGDPFTTVIRNATLMARIDVPARYRNKLRPGLDVFLEEPSTRTPLSRGQISSIDPSVNVDNQSLLVNAKFINSGGILRNGLRLRTRIVLGQSLALAIPVNSVTQSSGQSYVYRLGTFSDLQLNPGQAPLKELKQLPPTSRFALQTRVKLGPIQNNKYPVIHGLQAGDLIITSNLLNLRHGMPVDLASSSPSTK